MRVRAALTAASLALLAATPAAAQRCTAGAPVQLAQKVSGARALPRTMPREQLTRLAELLPVLKANPRAGAPRLTAWVAAGGFTAADRCPLVYALIRAVQSQTVPGLAGAAAPGINTGPGGTAGVMSQIDELTAALAALQADLANLKAQLAAELQNLKDLLANRPAEPGPQATPEARAAYSQAASEWQAKVAATQAKIGELQAAIAAKQAEIDRKQAELQALQGALPAAVDQAVGSAIP